MNSISVKHASQLVEVHLVPYCALVYTYLDKKMLKPISHSTWVSVAQQATASWLLV